MPKLSTEVVGRCSSFTEDRRNGTTQMIKTCLEVGTARAFSGASYAAFRFLGERCHYFSRYLNRRLPAGDRKLVMKLRIGEKECPEEKSWAVHP
jgi:hypothetical protein